MIRTLTVVSLLAGVCAGASADIIAESVSNLQHAGVRTIDVHGNLVSSLRGNPIVYSNLQTGFAADRAFSSTDLAAVFGDQLTTTGTGTLQDFSFNLFNSGSSAGALTSATVNFGFYRASDGGSLGSFNVNTGAIALNAGFFTTFNVTGLGNLGVNLDSTEIIVLQTVTALTGAANRLGVVSTTPNSVGSAVPQLYIQASTVGGGVPGFYNITSGGAAVPFTVGYQLSVPTPGAFALLGLGGLFSARRRR